MSAQPSPNDRCPCGSGKKFKRCCARADDPKRDLVARARSLGRVEQDLVMTILAHGRKQHGAAWTDEATRFYYFDEGVEEESGALFLLWLAFDYRPKGRTLADEYADRPLSDEHRRIIAAEAEAWVSIWEVEEIRLGLGLTLRDLLTDEKREVVDARGSENAKPHQAMLARVVRHGDLNLVTAMDDYALPPFRGQEVIDDFRDELGLHDVRLTPEKLRDPNVQRHLVHSWSIICEDAADAPMPELRNTSGEPLVLTVDRYEADPSRADEIFKSLEALEGAQPRDGNAVEFLRAAKEGEDIEGDTVFGAATLEGATLRIDTNSVERADALRARIEGACRDLIRFQARSHTDLARMLQERRDAPAQPRAPERQASPEEQAAIVAFKERYYERWLDDRIPALKGKTPREAAKTDEGRKQLDLLLRDIEHAESKEPAAVRLDVGALREKLGM